MPETRWSTVGDAGLEATWRFPSGERLALVANLGPAPLARRGPESAWGQRLYGLGLPDGGWTELPPWSVGWFLRDRPS